MPRKRKAIRLGKLRKTVNKWNSLYGLLVQAVDANRSDVIELSNRVQELERRSGLTWSPREGAYRA